MSAPVAAVMGEAADSAGSPATAVPDGVRLEMLRVGRGEETLFLVPGLGGDPAELTALASSFVGPQQVYAAAPLLEDAQRRPVTGMARMAELMVAAIRWIQPFGPYRLGGYSFGGLLALEVAQQLRTAGEPVEALFLIDAVYDERFWPRAIWLRAMVRRTGRQLLRIMRLHPGAAVRELWLRAVNLIERVMRRKRDAPDRLHPASAVTMRGRAVDAMAGYRPRFYDGPVTLFAASLDRHFGCDTVRLWAGLAAQLEVQRLDGDHLTIMHELPTVAVASAIDYHLARRRADWAGLKPVPGFARPMILTTMRWFSAARLAHSLAEAGFAVSACRPAGHPLQLVEGLTADCLLNRIWRLRSLVAAIRQARPDIILPDDESSLALLRRLHARSRTADPDLAALIAHSLGNVADLPLIAARAGLANAARALHIPVPTTTVVTDAEELGRWAAPFVLKTDGSWGGRGVAVVRDSAHARRVWRAMSAPPTLARGLWRLVVDREAGSMAAWARRTRPVVNAQEFVKGRDALVTVACFNGTVLALVCLEVVHASEKNGPAAVVRIIDHPGITEAARMVVGRFGLSGFCGLDFCIDDGGDAHLLELNPRVTPTSYLLVEGDYQRSRTIALFPAGLVARAEPGTSVAGVLDLPVRAPALMRRGQRLTARQHRLVARAVRWVQRKVRLQAL